MRKPYPTDLNDQEWAMIQAVIPPAKKGGRSRQGRRIKTHSILCGPLIPSRGRSYDTP